SWRRASNHGPAESGNSSSVSPPLGSPDGALGGSEAVARLPANQLCTATDGRRRGRPRRQQAGGLLERRSDGRRLVALGLQVPAASASVTGGMRDRAARRAG